MNRDEELGLAAQHRDLSYLVADASPARLAHDQLATDDSLSYVLTELTDKFVSDLQPRDGDPTQARYVASRDALNDVLGQAYQDSPIFRRLFNFAVADGTASRWLLKTDGPLSVRENSKYEHAGIRGTITLNLDAWTDPRPEFRPTYSTGQGPQFLTPVRAYLNTTVRALTGLPDQEAGHFRGPNIEYVNLICKQMGYAEPACVLTVPCADQPIFNAPAPPIAPQATGFVSTHWHAMSGGGMMEVIAPPPQSLRSDEVARANDKQRPGPLHLSGGVMTVNPGTDDVATASARLSFPMDSLQPSRTMFSPAGAGLSVLSFVAPVITTPPVARASDSLCVAGPSGIGFAAPAIATPPRAHESDSQRVANQRTEIDAPPVFATEVAKAVFQWRDALLPYASDLKALHPIAASVSTQQRDTLDDLICDPATRNNLVDALGDGGRSLWPKDTVKWWLEVLYAKINDGSIDAGKALTLLAAPCTGRYRGSFAAGLASCSSTYPNEAQLLIEVLGLLGNKLDVSSATKLVGTALDLTSAKNYYGKLLDPTFREKSSHTALATSPPQGAMFVRHVLLDSEGIKLHGGVGKELLRSRSFYDWIAQSSYKENPGLISQIRNRQLFPASAEHNKRHRLSFRSTPYSRMTKVLNKELARTGSVPGLLVPREVHRVAQEVVATLTLQEIEKIDDVFEKQRVDKLKSKARSNAETELRNLYRDEYVPQRIDGAKRLKRDLEGTSLLANLIDPTHAAAQAYLSASSDIRAEPREAEVSNFVDRMMQTPESLDYIKCAIQTALQSDKATSDKPARPEAAARSVTLAAQSALEQQRDSALEGVRKDTQARLERAQAQIKRKAQQSVETGTNQSVQLRVAQASKRGEQAAADQAIQAATQAAKQAGHAAAQAAIQAEQAATQAAKQATAGRPLEARLNLLRQQPAPGGATSNVVWNQEKIDLQAIEISHQLSRLNVHNEDPSPTKTSAQRQKLLRD